MLTIERGNDPVTHLPENKFMVKFQGTDLIEVKAPEDPRDNIKVSDIHDIINIIRLETNSEITRIKDLYMERVGDIRKLKKELHTKNVKLCEFAGKEMARALKKDGIDLNSPPNQTDLEDFLTTLDNFKEHNV